MKKVKVYTAQHSSSPEMENHLMSTGHFEDVLHREMSHNIAGEIVKDFHNFLKVIQPDNLYLSKIREVKVVAMDEETWAKISQFLNRNNFKWNEL